MSLTKGRELSHLVRLLPYAALLALGLDSIGLLGASTVTSVHYELSVGDHREMAVRAGIKLEVSRKGIVDLAVVSDEKIQITALRGGYVWIKGVDENGKLTQGWSIHVSEDVSRGRDEVPPPWACNSGGVQCDVANQRVSGIARSLEVFRELRESSKNLGWLFEVKLDAAAAEAYRGHLQSVVGPRLVVKSDGSKFTVEGNCDSKSEGSSGTLRQRLGAELGNDLVELKCSERERDQFRLRAKLRLVEDNLASRSGISPPSEWKFSDSAKEDIKGLNDVRQTSNDQIVGQPTLRLVTGVKTTATSGGEIFIPANDDRSEKAGIWRETGLKLQITLQEIRGQMAWLDYTVSLRQPADNVSSPMSLHAVEGTIPLQLAMAKLVAVIDFQSNSGGVRGSHLLSMVPIIGPLLRIDSSAKAKSLLQVWFLLEKGLDGEGEDDLPLYSDSKGADAGK